MGLNSKTQLLMPLNRSIVDNCQCWQTVLKKKKIENKTDLEQLWAGDKPAFSTDVYTTAPAPQQLWHKHWNILIISTLTDVLIHILYIQTDLNIHMNTIPLAKKCICFWKGCTFTHKEQSFI